MSESTDPVGETTESTGTEDVVDIDAMSEGQLRARHEQLSEQIASLEAEPKTIARQEQINTLRLDRNALVQAVHQVRELAASSPEDLSLDDAAGDTATSQDASADAATAAEATSTPEGEAPAATEDTAATQENQVSDSTPSTPEPTGPGASDVVAAAESIVAESTGQVAVTAGAGDRPNEGVDTRQRPRMAYTAGADQHLYTQGRDLADDVELTKAFNSVKLKSRVDTDVRAVVAGISPFEDDVDSLAPGVEILHDRNSTSTNDRIITDAIAAFNAEKAGTGTAHTAAICEPLDIRREIPHCGEIDTPFTNLFPQAPIGRGGFQYTPASTAAEMDGAINLWTQDDQDDIVEGTPSTWKPCIPIECGTPVPVTAEELVTCVTVDTSTEFSAPERLAEVLHKLRVQRARRREQYQLALFDATASGFTFEAHAGYGTGPTVIEAVETVLPKLVYTERLDEGDYDLVLEPGFVNKLTIDRHNQCSPAEMPGARAETLAWLSRITGLRVVVLRDFEDDSPFQALPTPGGSFATLAPLPTTNRLRLVPASAYIHGATGEESTGWQTDPQLARQNKKQLFSAEWILLAKVGCHPAAVIDITSDASGGRGGCSPVFESAS